MPRFFIDVYDGEVALRDCDGIELDSVEEAAEQAAALLPDMARDALPGRESHDFATLVRDADEAVVYRAALLFRGQRSRDRAGAAMGTLPEAEDLILCSRATRDAARRISARLRGDVRILLDLVEEGLRLVDEARTSLGTDRHAAVGRGTPGPRRPAPEAEGAPGALDLTRGSASPDR